MNIIDLPMDVLGIIFSYVNLELKDIVEFKKMCKPLIMLLILQN